MHTRCARSASENVCTHTHAHHMHTTHTHTPHAHTHTRTSHAHHTHITCTPHTTCTHTHHMHTHITCTQANQHRQQVIRCSSTAQWLPGGHSLSHCSGTPAEERQRLAEPCTDLTAHLYVCLPDRLDGVQALSGIQGLQLLRELRHIKPTGAQQYRAAQHTHRQYTIPDIYIPNILSMTIHIHKASVFQLKHTRGRGQRFSPVLTL